MARVSPVSGAESVLAVEPGSDVGASSVVAPASESVPRPLSAVESVAASRVRAVSVAGSVPLSAVSGYSVTGVGPSAGTSISDCSDWSTSAVSEGANRFQSPTASAAATMRMESPPRIGQAPGRLDILSRMDLHARAEFPKVFSRARVRGCDGYDGPGRLAPGTGAKHALSVGGGSLASHDGSPVHGCGPGQACRPLRKTVRVDCAECGRCVRRTRGHDRAR